MLEVKHLCRKYGLDFVLDNISFQIEPGDFFVLFGPDDAGKSEVVYNIMDLHKLHQGEILFEEKDIRKLSSKERREIRFVPDDIVMEEKLSAEQYMKMQLKSAGKVDVSWMEELCEKFEVDLKERLAEMTYESNKMTAVIGALITEPQLLILDEPDNFLTEETFEKLLCELKKYCNGGHAVILVQEKFCRSQGYCNKYLYLKEGKMLEVATMEKRKESIKAVTVKDGDENALQTLLGNPVAKMVGTRTYLFKKQMGNLAEILLQSQVNDFQVETLTMEEKIEEDYSRWDMN